jgi:hypothetical protein
LRYDAKSSFLIFDGNKAAITENGGKSIGTAICDTRMRPKKAKKSMGIVDKSVREMAIAVVSEGNSSSLYLK